MPCLMDWIVQVFMSLCPPRVFLVHQVHSCGSELHVLTDEGRVLPQC